MGNSVTLRVIGLASCASADGIDAALAEVQGSGPRAQISLKNYKRYPYPAKIRDEVFRAFSPKEYSVDKLSALDFALGELFAAAAIDVVQSAGLMMADVDLIGSGGQTVWNSPEQVEIGGMWARASLRIAEPAVIAERTGVTVIADFPAADVAAEGQGTPLTPYADFVLFRSPNRNRAVQNIGITGSATCIPSNAKLDQVTAFDTGPGSALIDAIIVRKSRGKLSCDVDGKLAAGGKPDKIILGRLMRHPFLQKRPPKVAGREEFGIPFADQLLAENPDVLLEDMAATVTAFTAQSIRQSYEKWLPKTPDDIIIGGAGARNPALMTMLAESFPRVKLYTHEDFGINGEAKDALAYALLAVETVYAHPANIPSATGAAHPVVLGKIVPGRNFQALAGGREGVSE